MQLFLPFFTAFKHSFIDFEYNAIILGGFLAFWIIRRDVYQKIDFYWLYIL